MKLDLNKSAMIIPTKEGGAITSPKNVSSTNTKGTGGLGMMA